jgi:hypothetical protein
MRCAVAAVPSATSPISVALARLERRDRGAVLVPDLGAVQEQLDLFLPRAVLRLVHGAQLRAELRLFLDREVALLELRGELALEPRQLRERDRATLLRLRRLA